MALLATLAAHDFGFIDTDDLAERIDATLTTVESLERFEGHLLNWYDTRTLAPLPPAYISTVDSGNLAGALLTLSVALQQLPRIASTATAGAARRRPRRWRRAVALFDGMNFRFLYDPQRQLFTIGYRLADARGAGTPRSVVLRPAGVRSAAGQLSRDRQGRRAGIPLVPSGTSRDQRPRRAGAAVVERHDVRVSDAAARHAELSGHAARRIVPDASCAARSSTPPHRGVPWGISESAYNIVDRHDTFQYKAFGVPGLGLKRGLGDELVVAPYATALAAMIDAPQSARQPAAADRRGPRGRLRIFRRHRLHARARPTITTTPPVEPAGPGRRHGRPHLLRAPRRHDAGRAGQRAARRSDGQALSRRPARAGHRAAAAGARAAPHADDSAAAARRDARRRAGAGHADAAVSIAAHGRFRTRSFCRTATT